LKEFEVQRSQAHQYIFEKENPSPDDPYELMKKTMMGFDFSKLSAEDWQMAERYVLVIDEINRGNIAGIFGELITLIEEDKRAGKPEALSVILPYSKQPFIIPPNLYIIGTMNTADRNVEALDTALRRRFTFVRVPPHPELLQPANFLLNVLRKQQYALEKNDEINVKETKAVYGFVGVHPEKQKTLQEVMEKKEEINIEKILKNVDFTGIDLERMLRVINSRIEKLVDADHCIGHAYFMEVMDTEHPLKALEKVFYQKLIPLLQEYFYGDDEKITLIIGKSFFEPTSSFTDNFFADTDADVEWLEDVVNRKKYHIKPLTGKAFRNAVIRIYTTPTSR
jgi:5-methylcytosine-specific restriction protein B